MTNLTAIVLFSALVTNPIERQVEGDYFPPPVASSWYRTNVVSLYTRVGVVGDGIKAALLTNTTPQFTNVVLMSLPPIQQGGARSIVITNGVTRGVLLTNRWNAVWVTNALESADARARGLPPVPKL